MKGTSVVSFLITLLLAGAVCIQGQEPVKDTNGDPVQTDEQYYILPVKTPHGKYEGGLAPVPVTLNPLCPVGISQGLFPKQPGLPISFAYPHPTLNSIVETDYDVTIEFKSNSTFCEGFSMFWKVSTSPTESTVPIIVGGNPKSKTSWFQIKEDGEVEGTNTYKLTSFTSTVTSIPGPWPPSASELVLTNDMANPLLVQFKNVDDPTTATTSTSKVEKSLLRMLQM